MAIVYLVIINNCTVCCDYYIEQSGGKDTGLSYDVCATAYDLGLAVITYTGERANRSNQRASLAVSRYHKP